MAGFRRLICEVASAVAPRHCAGCDKPGEMPICPGCTEALRRCPQPAVRGGEAGLVMAAFPFEEPARRIVHRAKYAGERRALTLLAGLASARLSRGFRDAPTLVVPVPLGRRRRRERGFNQAEVIATILAGEMCVPVSLELVRTRETAPQVGGDETARRANVTGAFVWNGEALAGTHVWLVDDVMTTGATTVAAGAALAMGGAGRVDVAVVALVL